MRETNDRKLDSKEEHDQQIWFQDYYNYFVIDENGMDIAVIHRQIAYSSRLYLGRGAVRKGSTCVDGNVELILLVNFCLLHRANVAHNVFPLSVETG